MTTHELKTWPEYYEAIIRRDKLFDLRFDDRGFCVGDTLQLREWSPITTEYTGREISAKVTFLLRGGAFGLESGNVAMGIRILGKEQPQ